MRRTIYAPVLILVIATLFMLGDAAAFDEEIKNVKEITVVTWRSTVNLKVEIANTPESWSRGLENSAPLRDHNGFMILFPEERVAPFSMKGIDYGVDVLLVSASGQIVQIYENLSDNVFHASPKKVLGLVFLREGFCKENEIKKGCLVISDDKILTVKAPPLNDEKHKESARKKLVASAKARRNDGVIQCEVAEFFLSDGDYKNAEKWFKKALKNRESARAHIGMGVIAGNNGRFDESDTHLTKALELEPLNMDAFTKLVKLKRKTGKLQPILELFEKKAQEHKDSLEMNIEFGRLYLELGDFESAQKQIEDNLGKFNRYGQAELERVLGDVKLRQGKMLEAANAYLEYISVFPNAPHAQDLRKFVLVHKVKKENQKQSGSDK